MKTRISKHDPILTILGLAFCAMGPPTAAESPPTLGLQTYAGLTITGTVGTVYSIEYLTNLAEPTENAWRGLEFLQLPTSPYLWVDQSAPARGKRFYRAVVMAPPTNMVFIPPGTFRMGSPTNEEDRYEWEGPQTAVIISKGFWMGNYEVTQREYETVMENNPSYFTGDPNFPVETVSWYDATNYCGTLTEQGRATGRITSNSIFRLPTEAEWEYACRALTSTRISYGDDPGYTNLTDYAWYGDNSSGMSQQSVGQKSPNPWGLYDMHGNVLEWCHDWWEDHLPGGIAIDPQGPATGSERIARSGFWYGPASSCRSAARAAPPPNTKSRFMGFRVVLAPGQP